MWYAVHILDVGDADAIVIKYQATEQAPLVTAVIDAGNIGDGQKVLDCIGRSNDGMYHIDYAFCTHPDTDHKGGFFDLFSGRLVEISNFCAFDPWDYLSSTDFAYINKTSTAKKRARAPFNHPTDSSLNLLDIAEKRGVRRQISKGTYCTDIPLRVLGPADDLYRECAKGMVENFAEMRDDPDFTPYDEQTMIEEESARSVIDLDDDSSCPNRASMILLFEPSADRRFLLPGDAACISFSPVISEMSTVLRGCILKVPHHGSKHNLSTTIIDALSPSNAVISAVGSKKHPNSAIVYWLSRHCNVFSTHKSKGLIYTSVPPENPAIPLKARIGRR